MPTSAAIQHQPRPGSAAGAFSFVANNSAGSGGAIDAPAAQIVDVNRVTPTRGFAFAYSDQVLTFFFGFPRVVTAALKNSIIAAGSGVQAVFQHTMSGTITVGNTLTVTLNVRGVNYPVTYTVVGGDTLATISTAISAAVMANAGAKQFITASSVGPLITYIAILAGTDANAFTMTGLATGTLVVTPAAATVFFNGTNGSYLV